MLLVVWNTPHRTVITWRNWGFCVTSLHYVQAVLPSPCCTASTHDRVCSCYRNSTTWLVVYNLILLFWTVHQLTLCRPTQCNADIFWEQIAPIARNLTDYLYKNIVMKTIITIMHMAIILFTLIYYYSCEKNYLKKICVCIRLQCFKGQHLTGRPVY